MRPVTKGASPYTSISDYHEARPYLKERIGLYCSYCGFEISHMPEVEHVAAKSKGGDETDWSNLLLGCKYCNTRKGTSVTPANVQNYLWPDQYNTAVAYSYDTVANIPQVEEAALKAIDPTCGAYQKAKNLFDTVELDHRPRSKTEDQRFWKRLEVCECAKRSRQRWDSNKSAELKDTIVDLALASGFFLVWMTIFKDEPDILNALIRAFPGTNTTVYDPDGHPLPVI